MYAMAKADDKKAFDDMMAEISSDESDDGPGLTPVLGLRCSVGSAGIDRSSVSSSAICASTIGLSTSASIAKSSVASVSYASESKPFSQSQSLSQGASFKLSKQQQEIDSFGQDASSYRDEKADQRNVTKRWLARPCGVDEKKLMQCYVERERSTFYGTTYRCYLDVDHAGSSSGKEAKSGTGGRFLMSAKKKVTAELRQ